MVRESIAIEKFKEYLRIKTVHPTPDYKKCCDFLCDYGSSLGLHVNVVKIFEEKPIVIMTLMGADPDIPSVLLNSHTDVVPVSRDKWTVDPFAAVMTENGNIYARGSQDMKCVGVAYLEAIRRLKRDGHQFNKTLHLSFVPDEEIGGDEGMCAFVESDEFKKLNVAFCLDEGIPSPFEKLLCFNGERIPYWVKVTIKGDAGHGSALLQRTAMERAQILLSKIYQFRSDQIKKLAKIGTIMANGAITSINVTRIHAGQQVNVIPSTVTLEIDIRIAHDYGVDGIEQMLLEWTNNPFTLLEFLQRGKATNDTPMDKSNEYWCKIQKAFHSLNLDYELAIFPGATDSRFLRQKGIKVMGISPFLNTPTLLHDHDEFLNSQEFLKGIDIYTEMIKNLTE